MSEQPPQLTPEQKAARERELDDIRWLMGDARGRRIMNRWLCDAHIFSPCYTGNSETFYREGRREHALPYFHDVLLACADKWMLMMQENKKG